MSKTGRCVVHRDHLSGHAPAVALVTSTYFVQGLQMTSYLNLRGVFLSAKDLAFCTSRLPNDGRMNYGYVQ